MNNDKLMSVTFVFGLAGFLLGGAGAWAGFSAQRQTKMDVDDFQVVLESLGESLEAVGERVEGLAQRLGAGHGTEDMSPAEEVGLLRRDVKEVNRQLRFLEGRESQLRDKVREILVRIDEIDKRLQESESVLAARPWGKSGTPQVPQDKNLGDDR